MTTYRKKPVVIDATQWNRHGDHPAVVVIPADHPIDRNAIDPAAFGWVPTLEGGHIVTPGDWIITGVKGEHYPCKPDIFAATYELATPPRAGSETTAPGQGVMGAEVDMTDSELTALLLKVYPHVATPHLKMARAAIAADRTRRLVLAEPWLKSAEVSERVEGAA
jgi:hypothetical protein